MVISPCFCDPVRQRQKATTYTPTVHRLSVKCSHVYCQVSLPPALPSRGSCHRAASQKADIKSLGQGHGWQKRRWDLNPGPSNFPPAPAGTGLDALPWSRASGAAWEGGSGPRGSPAPRRARSRLSLVSASEGAANTLPPSAPSRHCTMISLRGGELPVCVPASLG